jgi:hypothetical protein
MYASQAFAEGHYESARIHLHCLDLCRQGEEALIAALAEHKLRYALPLNTSRLTWVAQQAGRIFDQWCAKLIRDAEESTLDSDALKALPSGIPRNYEEGIKQLEHFIFLDIPVVRVLTALFRKIEP